MLQSINTSESLKALEEKYGLDRTLEFINDCLRQYSFPPSVKQNILSNLEIVAEKRKDTHFYLGVIGEASSGKSTLINALLNYNLLVTDVQLGTTTASTYICGGNSFGIDLYFDNEAEDIVSYPKDKNIFSIYGYKEEYDDARNVKEILAYATSKEWISKTLKRVEVRLPIPMLSSGLIIVDTPGINAPNERHFAVTSKTVGTVCDAAIVVIPSHTPFSEALSNFLIEHLRPYLHRCIYALSMIDQTGRIGRKRFVEVIYQRLCTMLSLQNPVLLPVSTVVSMEELGTPVAKIDKFEDQELKEFREGFSKLVSTTQFILSTQRVHIVLERVLNICKLLISEIGKQLDKLEADYLRQHEALLEAVLERPQASANSMLKKILSDFSYECSNVKSNLEIAMREQEQELYGEVKWAVNSMDSKKELQERLQGKLESVFEDASSNTQDEVESHMRHLDNIVKTCISSFGEKFNTIYDTLATLGGTINPVTLNVKSETSDYVYRHSSRAAIGSAMSTARSAIEEGEESTAAGFWVGVGAAILIPGIGLLLGPLLGTVLGHLFGPSLDTIKDQVKSELVANVKENYRKLRNMVLSEFHKSVEHYERIITKEVNDSFNRYNLLVEQMNNRDEKLRDEMESKRLVISRDREQTGKIATSIKSALDDLRNK